MVGNARLGFFACLAMLACAHGADRKPTVSAPPAAFEAEWQASADRRHRDFSAPALFEIRAIASAARPGFSKVTVPGEARRPNGDREATTELFLSDEPLIDSTEVQGAHLETGDFDFEADLALEWTSQGRQKWKQLSTTWCKQKVALMLNHRVISTPIIVETIDSPFVHVLLHPREDLAGLLRQLNPPVNKTAHTELQGACRGGRRQACMLLARASLLGRDLPYDPTAAEDAYQTACQLGEGEACFRSAYPLVHPDRQRRLQVKELSATKTTHYQGWLRRGCDLAHGPSCHGLAKLLLEARHRQAAPAELRT